jgi:hypothetical protein
MKKLIFYASLFVLSFLFFNADAQNVALGIQGGISIPDLSAGSAGSTPLSTGYSSRFGPDAGIYAQFKVSSLFSIQPGLEYSSQGGKKDGLQAVPDPNPQGPPYLYANYNSTAKLNYLMLPVLAKFGWDLGHSHWRFFVDAGPFLGYLVYAKQVTSGSSELYADMAETEPASPGPESFNATTDIKDQIHKANVGIEGNLGFAYKLKKSYIFISGGGNYGFINIQKVAADGSNDTGAATIVVGYSFWLGK